MDCTAIKTGRSITSRQQAGTCNFDIAEDAGQRGREWQRTGATALTREARQARRSLPPPWQLPLQLSVWCAGRRADEPACRRAGAGLPASQPARLCRDRLGVCRGSAVALFLNIVCPFIASLIPGAHLVDCHAFLSALLLDHLLVFLHLQLLLTLARHFQTYPSPSCHPVAVLGDTVTATTITRLPARLRATPLLPHLASRPHPTSVTSY